jgi:N-formylglutamate amidohydrolase
MSGAGGKSDAVSGAGGKSDAVSGAGGKSDAVSNAANGDGELWHVHRGEQPLLATSVHDGHEVRPEVARMLALGEADRLREEDPFTSRWTTVAANRVVPRRSRFEVDLNRPPDQAVYRRPEDAWGLHVWQSDPDDDMVDRSLSEHRAFYDLLRAILSDIEQQFGPFIVLDLHSYNHRRDGADAPPADPVGNPVVNVGTGNLDRERFGPLVDRFIADLSEATVAGVRLDVRENVRFRGGHFPQWVNDTFPHNGCALAVEFKKIYLDEWTGEPDEEAIEEIERALRTTVPGLIESLSEL